MTAELLTTERQCFRCGSSLTLEEMHYYERPDGSATCNECEGKWLMEVEEWRSGEREDFPAA